MSTIPDDNVALAMLKDRIAALEAENARLREALIEAREQVLTLAHGRGSEVNASDADLTGYIDAALR